MIVSSKESSGSLGRYQRNTRMQFVEIYKLNNDGTQRVIAVCTLKDGGVVCEGEKIFVENLARDGIVDRSLKERKLLYPMDGLKFLEQLPRNFKSGYLNASEIKSG